MNTYNTYLTDQGYAVTTIISNKREVEHFTKWCTKNSTTPITIAYKTCLKYIQYLTKKGNSKKTINHKLGSLKSYFKYLISEGCRAENPIEDTSVRGVQRTLHYNLLKFEELEDLYYSYQTEHTEPYHNYTAKRNKVIVGLLVYQGLDTADLKNLKLEHLQLHKGKLYVPSRPRSNARELPLQPSQIMGFMEYINEVRHKLLARLQSDTDKLFPYGDRFTITQTIIKKIKKYNHKVSSTKQIRASVISHWLGQHNLRKVQYLAGHRYISSTERYVQDDLENLQEIVNQYHPIQ